MNQKIVGKTAQEVVDNLTPSAKSWISKIIPAKGEIEENLARLAREGKLLRTPFRDAAKTDIRKVVSNGASLIEDYAEFGFNAQEAKQIASLLDNTNMSNVDEIFSKLKNIAGTDADRLRMIDLTRDEVEDSIQKLLHEGTEAATNLNGGIDNTITGINKIINTPRAYFDVADPAKKKARITTAAVGYAGVAVGGRYLSGGTLTRDNYGQRDIAGVPFI